MKPGGDAVGPLLNRLYTAALAFGSVWLLGGLGFFFIGEGKWSYGDCLYMAIITLSTVGFAETLPDMSQVPAARAWTVALILMGSGTLLYFASTLTALIVEGDLTGALRRRQMERNIDGMHDHVIVCGIGTTGAHVVQELVATATRFVVIEKDERKVERMLGEIGGFMFVIGDASKDEVLEEAGIRRARGLIGALTDDRDNLFVAITARALNDTLRIVVKAVDPENAAKMKRAGADAVVSPAYIGGMRLASEIIRPTVVQFLDDMVRDRDQNRRIEELPVPEGSPLAGRALRDVDFSHVTDTLVIAVRYRDGRHLYNPGPDVRIEAGQVLIVLARGDQVRKLHEALAPVSASLA